MGEAVAAGRSAPLRSSSSATAKGLRGPVDGGAGGGAGAPLPDVSGREGACGGGLGSGLVDAEDGDAGSAAASARNTACVERLLSSAFGLARRARAYDTFVISFFLIDASSVSSAVEKWLRVAEIGWTKARSTYFAVMNLRRVSRFACGVGFGTVVDWFPEDNLASQIEFDIPLPSLRSTSITSGVKELVSRVTERTFEMCVPRLRWIPEHSIHMTIPRLIDTQSTFWSVPQSAHVQFAGSASRICLSSR